ncbi:hypothetical protein HYC85_025428 [Camellia sinensis]|uniref:Uncharacterized protein n=1 Tax=Camellia sinensis TaxID=4442 RepID=A0A7J7GAZ9_CAMSI|nr:hypothetical protein HYC85_025428 [Camellia sinensis]
MGPGNCPFRVMLKRLKLSDLGLQDLQSLCKNCYAFCSSGVKASHCETVLNNHEPESETEWESLLKPFDLEKLRKSLNWISPNQLRKLLELPLDVSTSVKLFQWAGTQKGYCHSFDVYCALIDKLGAARGI